MGVLVDGQVAHVLGTQQLGLKAGQHALGEVDDLVAARRAEAFVLQRKALLHAGEPVVLEVEADVELAGELTCVEGTGEVKLAQGLARDVAADEAGARLARAHDGHVGVAEAPRAAEGVGRQQDDAAQRVVAGHLFAHLVRGGDDALELGGVDGARLAACGDEGRLDGDVAAHEVHAVVGREAKR